MFSVSVILNVTGTVIW